MLERLQAHIDSNKSMQDLVPYSGTGEEELDGTVRNGATGVTVVKVEGGDRNKAEVKPQTRDEAIYMRMLGLAFTLSHISRCIFVCYNSICFCLSRYGLWLG